MPLGCFSGVTSKVAMLCDNASETCRRHVPTLWRYLFGASLFGVVEAEDGEVYFAVDAVLIEVGQVAEVVSLAVLNHEDGVGFEHLGVEHQFGNGGEVGKIVWWVGKDDVELRAARFHKFQRIALHLNEVGVVELLFHLANEIVLRSRLLHAGHLGATA